MRQAHNILHPKMMGSTEKLSHLAAQDWTIFLNRESDTTNDLLELFLGMIQVLFDEVDEF